METFDYQDQFDRIKKDTIAAVSRALNIKATTGGREIRVTDIRVEDDKDAADWESQRQAVRNDKTWGVPLYASLELVDTNTGKVLSKTSGLKIATIPKPTDLGSFIVGGQHYQVYNQLRRKPGVYITRRQNDELRAEIHVAKKSFSIEADPKTDIITMGSGSSSHPLYPLLSRMGVSDALIAKTLGQKVLDANKAIPANRQVTAAKKLGRMITGAKDNFDSAEDAAKATADHLATIELAPDVMKHTFGAPHEHLDPTLLLRAAQEVMKAQRGERAIDERQSIEFKKVMSVSDFLKARMVNEDGSLARNLNAIRSRIFNRLNRKENPPTQISRLVNSNEITPIFESFFRDDELSHISDQTNPLNMLNHLNKVTITGRGGVQSRHGIVADERAVHPSHLGFIDPVHTPDSESIGVVNTMPLGVVKGANNELQTKVFDPKSGLHRYASQHEMSDGVVAFPDQFRDGKPVAARVRALVKGEMTLVDPKEVDAVLASPKQAFSISTNTIPFLDSTHGVRAQMATKMLEQALPLKYREAPDVQVLTEKGKGTFEKRIGEAFSIRAHEAGVVSRITPTRIVVKTEDGEVEQPLYNDLPLNTKSFLHAEPTVAVGDKVRKGQTLADSNFTRDSHLALGTNLRAAYVPYKGLNVEDGIVITESAQKKLTSEHLYKFAQPIDSKSGAVLGLRAYTAWEAGKLSLKRQAKLDADGVVRKGQIVEKGDPLWVGVRPSRYDPEAMLRRKFTSKIPAKTGFSETWDNDAPGEVVDVVRTGDKVKVYVKTAEPAQIGDKLTNRLAAKGIITAIIPDGEAPYTKVGDHMEHVEMILNPHGVVGRMNPSQVIETAASKIARKTGKPYVVENFSGENHAQVVQDELGKHGLSSTEELFDPSTNKPIGHVTVGHQYVLKLTKQATSQFSARAEGKYDVHGNPLKGGDDGSKAVDVLTMYGLLAHGARSNLREMTTYKATDNPRFWAWLKSAPKMGLVKPAPEPTMAYKKFEAYLKAAGVDVERNGSKMILLPMTDREVVGKGKLSAGEVVEPLFVQAKDLKDVRGGLVDESIFGVDGGRWGHIELAEPIPNPVFEDAIKTVAGLDKHTFDGFMQGKVFVDDEGKRNTTGEGVTGGTALQQILKSVDVNEQIRFWTDKAKSAPSPDKLNVANKRLKYLHALKKLKLAPDEAYIQTKLPVLPKKFRPIRELPDGTLSAPGLNTLYRDIGLVNNQLKWQHSVPYIPETMKADLRENLYNGAKALYGIGDPIAQYPDQRRPKGIIEQIAGDSAKEGFFQDDVLRRKQNLVGRGTIIPEPKLGIDEIGIPEAMAWEIFKPFVIRRLIGTSNFEPNDAITQFTKKTPAARAALEVAMRERPVIMNRAPSLHKFSIMAFKPKITSGRALKIPPLIIKGFSADFDGDACTIHVPILQDAVREANLMLPSKNLYNPGTGGIMVAPQNEAALGLYLLSRDPKLHHQVLDLLPPDAKKKFAQTILNKDGLRSLTEDLAKEHPDDYGEMVKQLKDLGDRHTFTTGFTVGLADLLPKLAAKNKILDTAKTEIQHRTGNDFSKPGNHKIAADIIAQADADVTKSLHKDLGENNLYLMVNSGARGNMTQLKQIVSAPINVADHNGKVIPFPITRSFAEGLPFSDYWSTLYGARSVAVDKQLQTQKPGAFNKEILATTGNNVISAVDCKTHEGVELPIVSKDVEDRFLSRDVRVDGHVIARSGEEVDNKLLGLLKERKVAALWVRSPLTCHAPKGTCAKCYGIDENGKLPPIGENVGVISGQALSEPLTQLTMKTFHSGGLAGTRGVITGYEKIDKILKMPKVFPGRATLARTGGKVEKIEPTPGGGGQNVYVGAEKHFVPKELVRSDVKVGSSVEKGKAISNGLIHPLDLLALRGVLPAQEYMVDEIRDGYAGQGVHIKRRAIETVVRSATNTTRVLDPGDSDFIHGDVAPLTIVEAHNRKSLGRKHLDDTEGHVLREDVGSVMAGTMIDDRVQAALKKLGKSQVEVGPRPIVHAPFFKSISEVPFLRSDWMSQMGYRKLEDAIIQGATKRQETDLHGYSPVPGLAYGAEFGDAPNHRSETEGVY